MTIVASINNDIIIPTVAGETYQGLGGDDTYILTNSLQAGDAITIDDTQGTANRIQLVDGLSIASTTVYQDAVQLVLSSGAIVNILSAGNFTFEPGGNATSGDTGTDRTFAEFVVEDLGATVPAAGADPVTGGAATIGESAGPTFVLTQDATGGQVDEGSTVTYTLTASENLAADTTFTYEISSTEASAADFSTATSGTVTIPAGSNTATFQVTPVAGDGPEFSEDFTVTITDSSGAAVGTLDSVIIDTSTADNTAPVVDAAQTFNYDENQADSSAVLGTVAASDNAGGTGVASFAITGGNDEGYFAINDSGEITLTTAGLAAASNDFETTSNTFGLMVTATDGAGNTSDAVDVTLNVADVDDDPPLFDDATLSADTITITYDDTLDQNSIPAPADFEVLEGGNTAIAVNSVSISGNVVTLALAVVPAGNVEVSYTPGTNPLQDDSGNDAAALNDLVVVVDNADPSFVSSTPADDSVDVAIDANIVLNFSETVVAGTGSITITNANDATDTRTIDVTDTSQVTVSGTQVTINPTVDLKNGANYNVQVAATAFDDLGGNSFAGISDATTLNFTSVANVGGDYDFELSAVSGAPDAFAGTTGDDAYNAGLNNSLETGDRAVDPSTTDEDTLDASFRDTGAAAGDTARPVLENVENINVRVDGSGSVAGGGVTFDLSQTTGTDQLSLTSGTAGAAGTDITFFGITSLDTTIKVTDLHRQALDFQADFSFANTLLGGGSDEITLGLSNVGQTQVAGGADDPDIRILSTGPNSGVEILNVAVNDAARLDELGSYDSAGATQLKTLNIQGAGTQFRADAVLDFNISGSVDAGGFSNGAINIMLNGDDQVSVIGGGGDDVVDFTVFSNASDSFNGGGGTDTVIVNTALTAAPTNWTSVEVFGIDNNAAALTQDVDFVGNSISTFGIFTAGAQDASLLDLQDNSTVIIGGAPGNIDLELKTDSLTDTLTVQFDSSRIAGADINVADLDIGAEGVGNNIIETLNIMTGATNQGVIYDILNPTGMNVQNVTIAGSTGLDLGGAVDYRANAFNAPTAMAAVANQVIDASGLVDAGSAFGVLGGAGVQQITGGAGDDTILGGAGADILIGGAGADWLEGDTAAADDLAKDKLQGGAGADTFIFDDLGDYDQTIAAGAATNADVIQDFVTGTDKIVVGGMTGTSLGTGQYVEITLATLNAGAIETQAAALGIADNTTYVAVVTATDTGRTWVVQDNDHTGAAGVEILAELSGVGLDGIKSSDFLTTLKTFDNTGGVAGNFVGTDAGDTMIAGANGDVINGGAGADTITGGAGADTLQGGDGNDTLTGGGNATVADDDVFQITGTVAAVAGVQNVDTITDFYAGAGSIGGSAASAVDELQFGSAFLGGNSNWTTGNVSLGASGAFAAANANDIYVVSDDTTALSDAAAVASLGISTDFSAAATEEAIFIADAANGTDANIWYVNDTLDGNNADVTAADVVLIGVLTGVDANDLVAADFAAATV